MDRRPKSLRKPELPKPYWDGWLLWWRGKVIREYRKHAPAQMAVLARFQRLNWIGRIDLVGLAPVEARTSHWALDTVKNLNRGLREIKFHSDGNKRGICWAPAD